MSSAAGTPAACGHAASHGHEFGFGKPDDSEATTAYHGGQEWQMLDSFVEDLSVTTNGLGPPPSALSAAREAISSTLHYPPLDGEPHHSELANFLWRGDPASSEASQRLMLGNGASELIDLLIRDAWCELSRTALPQPLCWCPGPSRTQYKEYERSARSAGFVDLPSGQNASLACIVNPTNPTGDYLTVHELRTWIEIVGHVGRRGHGHDAPPVHVLVDESMLMWRGPDWVSHSLASQHEWLALMANGHNLHVFIIHSWTKIWACPGLRIGSCICPTRVAAARLRARQPPWSVSAPALAFLSAAIRDTSFLQRTWQLTPEWGRAARDALAAAFPAWRLHGPLWTSWLWVDTGSEPALQAALSRARSAGLPVRSGAKGYDHPTCFRMAVRSPETSRALVAALRGHGPGSKLCKL